MVKKISTWFKGLSSVGKIVVASVAAVGIFTMAAAAQDNPPNASQFQPESTKTQQITPKPTAAPQPKIEKQLVTESKLIPFQSSDIDDPTLEQGKTIVKVAGLDGQQVLTYEITTTDGVLTDKKLVKEETTRNVVNRVIGKGTKATVVAPSCPNGTYTNTAGNVVCRPYESDNAPAGASAKCRDGTYSFSQSRRGTCSSHGGVAEWL